MQIVKRQVISIKIGEYFYECSSVIESVCSLVQKNVAE